MTSPKIELIRTAADTVIAASRRGDGPTVLLSGGLGMPYGVWQFTGVPDALVDAGFSVITYSARGLAPSSAPPAPYSVPEMADDAIAVLTHFEVDDAVLVGYSMGCYITQVLASAWTGSIHGIAMIAGLRSSAIGEIVNEMELGLIDGLGEIPESVSVFEQIMTTLGPGMLADDATVRGWWTMLTSGDPVWTSVEGLKGQLSASQSWMLAHEPTPERLSTIESPTLVVAYEHDVFFPPAGSRDAASHLPAADFHVLDGHAHGGLMLDPEHRATQLVVDFCRKVTAV
ncbi:alpha/beta fold hydrolase [Gordonia neofelifaecis]|uniref:Alpha/beta hydrolase fold protein n=1 Tax=Gordonia neofelifaecis NRRL B-59395 TaxID=644548 RepID=F1YN87_9ACTN|nr:alpha/beta hydrolase [Gordonia neofelifaecis]EGD53798.1 alpha/beta hydrolase fold protein [Gordonia neofelifaecis NRRL B-59395]